MEPEVWQKVKTVFDSVVLVAPDERRAYLERACAGDIELRLEVESLLESFEAADGFLEKPFAGEIADALIGDGDEDELEPGNVFNRYKIVNKIGVGGMGTVYLAQDTQLRRSVALKLLAADATRDPEQVARFVQEARYASLLNHPNILTIYEVGQAGNRHFISTEFIPGKTLRTRLADGPLEPREAIEIAIDVASALGVAHKADIVHRDIKPENIMLRDDGLLKVLDFGLAKLNLNERSFADQNAEAFDEIRTKPGLIVGTVAYMSPEQAKGKKVDARTDIWSLGVVLYEMIMGRAPFQGASPADTVASIVADEPKAIRPSPSPGLARKLRRIIGRCLSKSPDGRYATIREMLDDLKSLRREIEAGTAECRSVVILPFVNITGDASVSFFEFALADAVTTELARSRSLLVRPSSTVSKYLGKNPDPFVIGEELRVDAVLTANFLLSKNRIRVTTQLIDVEERNVVWSEQIDSDTDDIIGLQDIITHRIVEGLKCELETSSPPKVAVPVTQNSLAYIEYLRGRDQLRRYMFHTVANQNLEIAIKHFRRAVDLDPDFALAHCALGTSYLQRVIKVVGERDDLKTAAVVLDRALALDPQLIDARAYRAFIWRLQGETQRSRDELAELRRDAPNTFEVPYLSAACYRFDGDYESSFRCFEEMLRIDPTAQVPVHYCRARLFWYQSEFEKAFRELEEAERLEPNHPIVKFLHAVAVFRSGDPARAVKELRNLFSTYPSDGFRPFLSICLSAVGEQEAALGELNEAAERIGAVDPDVSYWLASAYLVAGKTGEAFKWLEQAIALGNHNLRWFEADPVLEPIRDDPRYIELVSPLKGGGDSARLASI